MLHNPDMSCYCYASFTLTLSSYSNTIRISILLPVVSESYSGCISDAKRAPAPGALSFSSLLWIGNCETHDSKIVVVRNRQIASRALCCRNATESGYVFLTPYFGVLCTAASDSAAKACPAVIVCFVQREPSKTEFHNYLIIMNIMKPYDMPIHESVWGNGPLSEPDLTACIQAA